MTPLWLRLWHWGIAVLFVILAVTGIVLTYSSASFALIDYGLADTLHQVTGILFSVLFAGFLAVSLANGYWRRYQRIGNGLFSRIGKFASYVWNGAPMKPDASDEGPSRLELSRGFLILIQHLLSIASIVILSPLLIATGLVLYYPELMPETVAGLGGVWPFALAHYWASVAGVLFLLFHVYISTIAGLRRMIKGR